MKKRGRLVLDTRDDVYQHNEEDYYTRAHVTFSEKSPQ